jgi:two-component system response regulator HydG
MRKRILLLHAAPAVRASLHRLVTAAGLEALSAATGAEAIARLAIGGIDLCLVDLQGPDIDGIGVLAAARECTPPAAVVILTSQGTVHEAVSALRAGAVDFLPQPVEPTALDQVLGRVLAERPEPGRAPRTQRFALIGEHPAMRLVVERIEQVADTDASVLIRGETGTGKEVVARLIHATSARRGGPFVAVNMAAIPESLAESELLGHTEGAFTGADRARSGRLLAAQGGTLFLDEIGDMPLALQAKILRVLQEREVTPVGGNRSVAVDVRVIAATHRNLEQMVRDGLFREDLYYRLDVIPIEVPPLRDRRDDVRLLAEHFRREFNQRDGGNVPAFSLDVMQRLCCYDWPGNVRQLENIVERLVVVARNREVTADDLPTNLRTDVVNLNAGLLDLPPSGVDLRSLLAQLEDRLIGQALARTGGNKNRAAELLGLNRTTLVEKLRRRNVA